MADPVSIIAIAGLAYIGKKLSDPKPELYQVVSKPTEGPIIIQVWDHLIFFLCRLILR